MRNVSSGNEKIVIWVIAGVLVLGTVGLIYVGAGSGSSANQNFTATTAPVISPSDWTTGPADAKVALIEYGDYQCPACGAYEPVVKQLLSDYGSKILFVFRNFPLTQVHEDAQIAAQAAGAAGAQGKYWEMHDMLYEKQSDWPNAAPDAVVSRYFDGYASSLGLDVNKFNQDIASDAVTGKVANDVAGGNIAQIDHTPTFFLNLKQIPNPRNYNDFKSAIVKALTDAGVAP